MTISVVYPESGSSIMIIQTNDATGSVCASQNFTRTALLHGTPEVEVIEHSGEIGRIYVRGYLHDRYFIPDRLTDVHKEQIAETLGFKEFAHVGPDGEILVTQSLDSILRSSSTGC